MEFIEFILATIGLTFIITQSYLFKNFREWISIKSDFFGKLFKCSACFGFWSGVFVKTSLIFYYHNINYLDSLIILLYGFIGSIICYVTYLLIKPLINKYD